MTQQAIVILEQGLHRVRPIPALKAYRGAFPLTNEFINAEFLREKRPGGTVRESRAVYRVRRKR